MHTNPEQPAGRRTLLALAKAFAPARVAAAAVASVAIASVATVAAAIAAEPAAPSAASEAQRLSRKLDELYRSRSSRGRMSMHVKTPHYERSLEMEVVSRGMDDTLVRILQPQKERGTATLKRGNEMWNYLPKIAKTIRVPPSMMMGSWMGSDLTNDDLVRASSWERDYDIAFAPDRDTPTERCLAYVPRPAAAVTWKRVVGCFDRKSELPTRIEYFDEKDRKARTMRYSDVRELGGRTLPVTTTIEPHLDDRKGNLTVMKVLEMQWDAPVTDDDFSQAALRRGL